MVDIVVLQGCHGGAGMDAGAGVHGHEERSKREDATSVSRAGEVVCRMDDTGHEGFHGECAVTDVVVRTLRSVPWIRDCGDAVVDQLAARARLQTLPDGARVSQRGRHGERLLVVVRGSLELSMASPQGRRHVLNVVGPGVVFGLIPVLDGQPWLHDAAFKGLGEVLWIHRDDLLSTMRDHQALSSAVVLVLCARARKTYDALAAHSLLSVPARLARTLLLLLEERGGPVLALTQADLADMLGVTRQSLNTHLRALAVQGLIALRRGRVEVLTAPRLRQAAGLWD